MSTDAKTVGGIVITGCAAGLAAVAVHAGWTLWPAFLGIPLIYIAVVMGSRPSGDSQPALGTYSDSGIGITDPLAAGVSIAAMLPGIEREFTLPRMQVHSAADGYDFRFAATVHWRESVNVSQVVHSDFAAVARAEIVRRAADVLAAREPGEVGVAEAELAGVLAARLPDNAGLVEAWADDVTLTLSDADTERMRRLAEIRKDEEVWVHEREYEKHRRAYLGDDVLKSAGSAVVWALSRKEDAIERAVGLIGPLALLSAAANDSDVSPTLRHLIAPQPAPFEDDESQVFEPVQKGAPRTTHDYVDEFADHLGFPPDRAVRGYFVSNFVSFLKTVDRAEEADDLQRAYYGFSEATDPLFDINQPDQDTTAAAGSEFQVETGAGSDIGPDAGPEAGLYDPYES